MNFCEEDCFDKIFLNEFVAEAVAVAVAVIVIVIGLGIVAEIKSLTQSLSDKVTY